MVIRTEMVIRNAIFGAARFKLRKLSLETPSGDLNLQW
jgi:hypothetical protein